MLYVSGCAPTGYSSIRQRRKSCGARHHVDNTRYRLPTTAVRVGADTVAPTTSVRDLGIYIDSDLSMRTQVTHTVAASCFAVLRQLRSIRRSVPDPMFQSLVVSLVLTKLGYGNTTLTVLPAYQYRRLQSVLNAAARLIYRRRVDVSTMSRRSYSRKSDVTWSNRLELLEYSEQGWTRALNL